MSAAPRRVAAWLAGLWAGMTAAVGFVSAPVLFATLARADAGRAAARLFALDAAIGLGFGAVLLVLALQGARRRSESGASRGSSRFSAEMVLVLAALFCIVAGNYAIEPMLALAGRGEGPSFAVLHGVASAFFVAKLVAIALLSWRLAGPAPIVTASETSSAAPPS